MLKRFIFFATLCGLICSCSEFRSGAGGYKKSSDYPESRPPAKKKKPNSDDDEDSRNPASIPINESTIQLEWPVGFIHITQNFEPGRNPRHKGIDIGGRKGTPVFAAGQGRVIYTGKAFHGYGNMILIEHGKTWATLYAHLSKIQVREGQIVKAGTAIGSMGKTGHATGVHLHFEVMHNKEPVDPLDYLHSAQIVTHKSSSL
jgi:murein DD-endopeptidase MepM/ murein hydrolase activator NlpD